MTGNPDTAKRAIYPNVNLHVEDTKITICDPRNGIILAEYEIRATDWVYNLDEGDSMPTGYKLIKTS